VQSRATARLAEPDRRSAPDIKMELRSPEKYAFRDFEFFNTIGRNPATMNIR
jgi:hypothetical protein